MRTNHRIRTVLGTAIMTTLAAAGMVRADDVLKAGIIGCDTSHVPAFTKLINDPKSEGPLAGVTVVAAYPGGSPDIASSRDRVEGFTKTLSDMGIEIVDSVPALLEKVDVVLLESVDGRPHLEQVIPVIDAGKPVFIDKPLAGSLEDAVEIHERAKRAGVPVFSSSSLRFSPGILGMRNDPKVGDVVGCSAFSPCSLEPTHPDLFWYGVHGCEILYTIMGTGCETVQRTQTDGAELVVGVWEGGRIGTYRGIREGKSGYGAMVFGTKGIAPSGSYAGYQPLVVEICKFFHGGPAPVSMEETVEMFAFMEAADESKRQGGKPVELKTVIQAARAKVLEKLGPATSE